MMAWTFNHTQERYPLTNSLEDIGAFHQYRRKPSLGPRVHTIRLFLHRDRPLPFPTSYAVSDDLTLQACSSLLPPPILAPSTQLSCLKSICPSGFKSGTRIPYPTIWHWLIPPLSSCFLRTANGDILISIHSDFLEDSTQTTCLPELQALSMLCTDWV